MMMITPRPKKLRKKAFSLERFAPESRRGRFLYYYLLIPLAVLFVVYLLINNLVMPIIVRHGSEFPLMDITGKSQDEATSILDEAGLGIEISAQEYRSDKPEGTIMSQYPEPGVKIKSGRIIKVSISSGAKDIIIPALSGFTIRQAKLNIEAAGLILGDIAWTYSDSLPESVVVFSYPSAGANIPVGSAVNLMVNRGQLEGTVLMPDLVGKTLDEARKIIDDVKLKLGQVRYKKNPNFLPETVLEQSIEADIELETGDEIDLVVSTTD
jgi:beta-lactam-binding protein with PASTA domain